MLQLDSFEVFPQLALERIYNPGIHLMARYELTVIKPVEILHQHLNIPREQCPLMVIDRPLRFMAYHFQTVQELRPLFKRQVQRFKFRISEE